MTSRITETSTAQATTLTIHLPIRRGEDVVARGAALSLPGPSLADALRYAAGAHPPTVRIEYGAPVERTATSCPLHVTLTWDSRMTIAERHAYLHEARALLVERAHRTRTVPA